MCPGSCLAGVLVGSGYLHTLKLVSLVGVVGVARVLVGSGYLHALKLVSLVRVPCWFVLVGSGYLHALKLVSLVGVSLVGLVTCIP